MNTPTVLCFNLSKGVEATLHALCASLGIALKPIDGALYTQPLCVLAGIPASRPSEHIGRIPFDDPMLVMCGLDEATFDLFLQALRFSGIPRIDLKAVLTPTNMTWNAVQLHEELCRERDAMRRMRGQ